MLFYGDDRHRGRRPVEKCPRAGLDQKRSGSSVQSRHDVLAEPDAVNQAVRRVIERIVRGGVICPPLV
jgi:hypothetical protein